MASLDQTKLAKLPEDLQHALAKKSPHELLTLRDALTDPFIKSLPIPRVMKNEIPRLIIVPPSVVTPTQKPTQKKRPTQIYDYDSPKAIMRMRVSRLNQIHCQACLGGECHGTLTCTSLLGDGNGWFDPGSHYRWAMPHVKFRSLRLNIISYPTDAKNNDPFFSPAAKLREIIDMLQPLGGRNKTPRPLIRVYVAFIQSENLDGYTYKNDASQFDTTTQRMVQEALIATRKMIEEEQIAMHVESNGDVLLEEGKSILSQQDVSGKCRDPPPYTQV
ncbi:putative hydroxymethylpyrimidine/phosphomethylpyrimidine kinase 2 [Venturia nashicola]|uniref:Putative hydroxymethylpyrimidine/phosphomethylpyrimidine kinase 2 n=1 Tax=Venturia nashicola TaxID=86259 RepID=A0A4Z1NQ87_9PEZI|nr:putative hydroxymethylpyrimidine/phosphomethylpyrimidine kinase 2 [Venturia nashicola]TLD27807.1 putative hydroxymethylpyrimidine/phosphomethylpyrimidine kinase 2 [Venturia nashicola]